MKYTSQIVSELLNLHLSRSIYHFQCAIQAMEILIMDVIGYFYQNIMYLISILLWDYEITIYS